MPKYFHVSDEKHPNKHILVLRHEKNSTSVFSCDKGCWLGPSVYEEWKKNIFIFVEYIIFAPDKDFCCWIECRVAQNV